MKRREFLTLVAGGAVIWPDAVRAQSPTIPLIGFLNSESQLTRKGLVQAFGLGLSEEGYAAGRNVAIEYRWADGQYQRLEEHAADLVHRQVNLIAATGGIQSARVAMGATTTIPILFISGADPVRAKLVTSINRPGGNATGVSVATSELVAKRLQLLRELAPHSSTVAMLQNARSYSTEFEQNFATEVELKEAAAAASAVALRPLVLDAAHDSDLEAAINTAVKNGADALFVSADPFFNNWRDQIVALAAHHRLPAIYPWRQYAEAGGLMSYGPSLGGVYQQIGHYAGRILKGAKPSDLPVQMPMTFEMVVNLKTAKVLELDVPPLMLVRATNLIQ
jgi:putative ABC transport system substrate-binding protein